MLPETIEIPFSNRDKYKEEYDLSKIQDPSNLIEAIERNNKTEPILCPKCFRPLIIDLFPNNNPNIIKFTCENLSHLKNFYPTDIINHIFRKGEEFHLCQNENCENKLIKDEDKGFYCLNCEIILCNNCKQIHINNNSKCEERIIEKRCLGGKCETHLQRDINYFCIICHKNLCAICYKRHKDQNHQIIDFNENNLIVDEKDIQELRENIKKAKTDMDKFISNNKDKLNEEQIKDLKIEIFFSEKIVFSFDEETLPNYQQLININNLKWHKFKFEQLEKTFNINECSNDINDENFNKNIQEKDKTAFVEKEEDFEFINLGYGIKNDLNNKDLNYNNLNQDLVNSFQEDYVRNEYYSSYFLPQVGKTLKIDYSYKIIVLGKNGVGKTQLISRITRDKFYYSISSIAINCELVFLKFNIKNEKKIVKIMLCDTAGQERFRSLSASYIKGSDGVFLVYDITYIDSFFEIFYWIEEVKQNVDIEKTKMILLGNKKDLKNMDIEELRKSNPKSEIVDINYPNQLLKDKGNNISCFKEISCKENNEGEIQKIFVDFVMEIMRKNLGIKKNNIKLGKYKNNENTSTDNKKKCC